MALIRESVIKTYKKYTDLLRDDLGRNVQFILPTVDRTCPNCKYNINDNSSSGVYQPEDPYPSGPQGVNKLIGPQPFLSGFCPVCNGAGTIVKDNIIRNVKCLIEWLPAEKKKIYAEVEGISVDAEIRSVVIKEYDYALLATHFIVDGKTVYLAKEPSLEGLRDLIKFSFLVTKENPSRNVK